MHVRELPRALHLGPAPAGPRLVPGAGLAQAAHGQTTGTKGQSCHAFPAPAARGRTVRSAGDKSLGQGDFAAEPQLRSPGSSPCPARSGAPVAGASPASTAAAPRFAPLLPRPAGTALLPARHRGMPAGSPCTASAPARPPTGLHVLAIAFALEVSVGKTNTVTALNNSNVLLPCTFTTCIGFQDLVFKWYFNTTELIYHGKIKTKTTEPTLIWHNPRVEFVGSTTKKENNISIVLNSVEFSDAGKYTCHVKNPKERNAQHNATIFLTVVHKMVETDNTVTLIIVGVVGGLIGLLILFMLIKRVVLFIIKKTQDGKKECLVSSSGNDNTENGLAGSKAEQKAPPKA
ncbi:sodium channel regulatory subunit beta-4 isoform X1 [Agelaius phoeniceus]|uniref:sodium channel regulatory subunit beta-4 isoform X1 n=1 Tax=Agelaius phoeniceus TaxID=39638 RepID=UPI004054C739